MLGVYSLLLTFGSVALQVVLLYVKLPVRITLMFYLAISCVMVVFSLLIAFTAETADDQEIAYYTLLYQLGLNGPTLLFMWPFFFYLNEVDNYIREYYPTVYKLTRMQFIQKIVDGEIDVNGHEVLD